MWFNPEIKEKIINQTVDYTKYFKQPDSVNKITPGVGFEKPDDFN